MAKKTVAMALASARRAMENCRDTGNTEWGARWEAYIARLIDKCLPHGSGIDGTVELVGDTLKFDRMVFSSNFHHMSEHGYYDGWTTHTVVVTPGWDGADVKITGKNRNDIKDYLHETWEYALNSEVPENLQP